MLRAPMLFPMLWRVVFFALFAAWPAVASEEEYILWHSVTVRSPDLPDVGIVTVEATAGPRGTFEKFTITAFGRSRSLSSSELQRIAGFPLEGVNLTHEGGYVPLGAHTINVHLERTRYDPGDKPFRERVSISLPKNAEIIISEPRRR